MSLDYVIRQLGENERVLYTERHHWIFPIAHLLRWILAAAAILALMLVFDWFLLPSAGWVKWGYLILIVPAVRIVWGFIAWRMNVYVLTNRRVAEVTGVIRKQVSDSSLEKLTDVVLTQGVLGRLLHYGTIEILTAAAGAGVNYLKQIRRPLEFKQAMVDAKEQLEREFGGSG